jgi:hypothetical protein
MNIITRASHSTDASWPLRHSTLWIRFIAFSKLGWLSIGLWSVVTQPCYIHCNISTEKFISKHCSESLILIDCEQTRQPLCKQLWHVQIFMHNMFNTIFWYLYSPSYLDQVHFTTIQNYFVDFFEVFVGSSLFLFRASTACIAFDRNLNRFNLANHFSSVDFAGAESK